VRKFVIWLALGFLVLSALLLWLASRQDPFISNVMLALFSATVSIAIALFIVNFLVDQRSKRIAAAPLVRLVQGPILHLHNEYFIRLGREKFGTHQFNSLIDAYQNNGRDPIALSPDQRERISEMIEDNKSEIISAAKSIDVRLSDLITVLGWSFDAKIIASALTCKQNISEMLSNIDPLDDVQRLKRTEMYLDIDASASGVLKRLVEVLGEDLKLSNQRPPVSHPA
jgi:hypothetical protein